MFVEVKGHKTFVNLNGQTFDPAKPSIVFVHGAAMEQSAWAAQARYFAYHDYNSLYVNLPAHGPVGSPNQSAGEAPTTIAAYGDWVVDFLDAMKIEKAVLVGHSMGTLIGLEVAATYPNRLEKMILVGAAPSMPVHPALVDAASKDDWLAEELMTSWGHGLGGHLGGNKANGVWMKGTALSVFGNSEDQLIFNDLSACSSYETGMDSAAKIACPTLIISGKDDKMTPARQGAKLAAAIPDCKNVVLPVGHMMPSEAPNEVLDLMIEFLAA